MKSSPSTNVSTHFLSSPSSCDPRHTTHAGAIMSIHATRTVLALSFTVLATACGPKAVRGGEGTANPNLDQGAMSTTLDKVDIEDLVKKNSDALFASPFWARDVQQSGENPIVAIWPIENHTSEHLDDQMLNLLSQLETTLVNSAAVSVVSRERQAQMAEEVGVQQGAAFDPATAAAVGKQLGAKYYFTGKLTSTDERMKKERRVQYALFLQVLEVETSLIKFQHQSERTKAIVR
ncbi:MAG: penicillin-binding protein activator LpoB [Myxococcales bacterium FL481]|nr:MAG: penicillin-binding protein activator LpoB [Myxococcales bacterium FL481]